LVKDAWIEEEIGRRKKKIIGSIGSGRKLIL